MSTAVVPGKPADMEREAATVAAALIEHAESLCVVDTASAGKAAADLRDIVQRKREVEQWFKPLVDGAFAAHRALTQRRAETVAKFAKPEAIIRGKLTAYTTEVERKRREAVAAAAQSAREEAERQQYAKAEAAMDDGDLDEAECILEAPAPLVVVPAVHAEPPAELEGVSFSTVWQFEVTDEAALPRQYLAVDVKKIRRVVTALGAGTDIPGVRVWSEKVSRVRV